MTKKIRILTITLFAFIVTSACSAQQKAPTDQLINGPFDISTKWQTIRFLKPLEATPQVQYLQLLFCNQQMEFINLRPDEVRTPENSGDFKRTVDNKIFEPEVIVHNGKKEYILSQTSSGSYYAGKAAGCLFIGYSLEGEGMEAFLPEGTQFFFAKVKANISITADHIYWHAPYYERYPNKKWSDLHPSKIINMESQVLPSDD